MKVRWREHELLMVATLVAIQLMLSILAYIQPAADPGVTIALKFKENGLSFTYWKNVLLPQTGAFLLILLIYCLINRVIIPVIKKISFQHVEKLFTAVIIKPIVAIILTAFLLAISINILSYYGQPHLFNYKDYQLLALTGYNDKPLTNLFFGFERALGLVVFFTALAGAREFFIWLIERPGAQREFRVLVTNTITPLLFLYFLIPVFWNPPHSSFMDYVAWTTPLMAIYIYFTFWLFPYMENRSWLQRSVLIRLFTSTGIAAAFSAVVFSGSKGLAEFALYWLLLLLIVTPVFWLLYLQRRVEIIRLKGLESALAKSTTDLQFLRSQINPHFLFNTLNTLYGTAIKEKAEQTATGIQLLGDMMRFMLQENNLDFISMNKEIEYLKNYISLQKLRTPPSPDIVIEDNIDEVKCNRNIAPMLLIPFVENAFKHGISLKEKSWITIKLECGETFTYFEVRNSIHPRMADDTEKHRSGIGLKNVAERLKLLYPGSHELSIKENETEFFARLVIK